MLIESFFWSDLSLGGSSGVNNKLKGGGGLLGAKKGSHDF